MESREVVPARARRIVRSRQSRDSKVSARKAVLAKARRRMRS